jgi:predicted RNA-binding Zn ribbon-like protein
MRRYWLRLTAGENGRVANIRRVAEAPGDLKLVRAFANTLQLVGPVDEIADPPALGRWLAGCGLVEPGKPMDGADVERAASFRRTLRGLLAANTGLSEGTVALREFNTAMDWMGATPRLLSLDRTGISTATADLRQALGRLAGIVLDAVNAGTFARLKLCARPECGLAFYDHGRNAAGRWCDMAICGNRAKVAAHRERRRGLSADEQPRSVEELLIRATMRSRDGHSG